jgi:hypothetical protein
MRKTRGDKRSPEADGVRFYRGRSMEPTLRPGDILCLERRAGVGDLEPGDVIVFAARTGGRDPAHNETVHRIVRRTAAGFVTRGDRNPLEDEKPVRPGQIAGRVVRVERAGRIKPVRGGQTGLSRANRIRARRAFWRALASPLRPLYAGLRRSGIATWVWRPRIERTHFCAAEGDYVEYSRRGRVVGTWWPARNEFYVRKPFDLVLWREIDRGREADRGRAGDEAGGAPRRPGT